jgi:hypothetical protein
MIRAAEVPWRRLRRALHSLRSRAQVFLVIRRWKRRGRPVPPPPEVKQRLLRGYARRFDLHTFIETGTFMGDTTAALAKHVSRVFTIELSPELAARARARFAEVPHIVVLEGDSSILLPGILEELRESALFWLDGHYSEGITARGDEDTPIRSELGAILDHPVRGHVILIDDARLFKGGEYPTIAEVADIVGSHSSRYDFELHDDIIRLTPPWR